MSWLMLVIGVIVIAAIVAVTATVQLLREAKLNAARAVAAKAAAAEPDPRDPTARVPVLSEPAPARILSPAEAFAALHELAFGVTTDDPEPAAAHAAVADATLGALANAATDERYAPRRPNMLPRLVSATNDEKVSRRELAAIISRDPALVGSLLKMANSSYYRITPEPIESVDRAVALLGTDGLRSLISAALMQPIFRVAGTHFPRFPEIAWEHAFRSASAAVPYAVVAEKSDPFAAELLSLVMGLAGIVIFRVALDHYALEPQLSPHPQIFARLLDSHSGPVAQHIGASWELSERMLVALDHQRPDSPEHTTALGRSLRFGRTVAALAVVHLNQVIDEPTARFSLPKTAMSPAQLDRMWTRLILPPEKGSKR